MILWRPQHNLVLLTFRPVSKSYALHSVLNQCVNPICFIAEEAYWLLPVLATILSLDHQLLGLLPSQKLSR
jgi:hypothetical protein